MAGTRFSENLVISCLGHRECSNSTFSTTLNYFYKIFKPKKYIPMYEKFYYNQLSPKTHN